MKSRGFVRRIVPHFMLDFIRRRGKNRVSRSREESNRWLAQHCGNIEGRVLSIGSGTGNDGQGRLYKEYFVNSASYTTSEVSGDFGCDLVLDVQSMPEIEDESFDCLFCSGVLEHVEDPRAGLNEMTRVLKSGGILLLGLSFRQAIHMPPKDYWRFTEYGIRHLLEVSYEILDIIPIDSRDGRFPAAYWTKARKVDPQDTAKR